MATKRAPGRGCRSHFRKQVVLCTRDDHLVKCMSNRQWVERTANTESLARVILLTVARLDLSVSRVWVYRYHKPSLAAVSHAYSYQLLELWKAFMRNEAAGRSIDRSETEP
jgi:hypothetical protein